MRRGKFTIPKAGKGCVQRVNPLSAFDKRSLRWVKSGRGRVLVGCPRGEYLDGACQVGLRAYEVVTPLRRGQKRCELGKRRK
jgi:hypothetical protein